MPPQEEENPKKSKGKKDQFEVTIVNIEYPHVKMYEMCTDYDRTSIVILAISLFLVIKIMVNSIIGMEMFSVDGFSAENSSFIFFLTILAFAYVFKLGIEIFLISSYSIKVCLLVCLGLNFLFVVL